MEFRPTTCHLIAKKLLVRSMTVKDIALSKTLPKKNLHNNTDQLQRILNLEPILNNRR